MLSGVPGPEHLRCELRIDLEELRGDGRAQEAQRLGRGRGRHRHLRGPVEIKAGVLYDLGDAVAGMHARQREAPPASIESLRIDATSSARDNLCG